LKTYYLYVAAAILVVLIAGGVFALVWFSDDPELLRDWVLIIFFSFGILTSFVVFLSAIVMGIAGVALFSEMRVVVVEKVVPLTDRAMETMLTVQGTTEFLSERAVKPVIKTYSFVAGARRAAGVITGLGGRKG
jgi:hypothetical protein